MHYRLCKFEVKLLLSYLVFLDNHDKKYSIIQLGHLQVDITVEVGRFGSLLI